jgi:hypothetical protein
MASKRGQDVEEIDELLEELDLNIKRLRIEYDLYLKGSMKREPYQLLGRVQKTITKFASDPPRRVAQKFRFNSLVARFQAYRQLWGRTMRELESGTHRSQLFRSAHSGPPDEPRPERTDKKSAVDQLTDALIAARRKNGQETKNVSKERIAAMVQQQRKAIAAKYGNDVRIAFRVVVEDGKAKVKANVKRARVS